MKEVKKMLNAKLKHHLARPHAFPHEISTYIPKTKTIQPNDPKLNHI